MFRNYLKFALRNLARNKTFSFINIIGLSAGTLCCLYIILYIQSMFSYDRYHQHAENIYRVTSTLGPDGDQVKLGTTSPPVAPALKADFAEVQQFTRLVGTRDVKEYLLAYQENAYYVKDVVYADSTFFDIFNYHFISGNAMSALKEPNTIVLLKDVADKIFRGEPAIGKVIQIENAEGRQSYRVSGVVDESLGQSHIRGNVFITLNSGGIGGDVRTDNDWAGHNFVHTYVRLAPGTNVSALEAKIPDFLKKYGGNRLEQLGMKKQLHLQWLGNIHTTTGYENEMKQPVSRTFLYLLLLVAILIQLIACINFMNLSTAFASRRAKEVGVRKVMGAVKQDFIRQFLSESTIMTLLSILLALALLMLAMPYLNRLTGAAISWTIILNYRIWLLLLLILVFTGFLAGSYPAFYLSAFQAIKVIRGDFSNRMSAAGLRRLLIIFQFSMSIMLIIGIVIIYSQLNYIKNKDLGYDKKQKLVLTFHTNNNRARMSAIKSDLQQQSEVLSVARANSYPSQQVTNDWPFFTRGGDPTAAKDAQFIITDENYLKATGIRLLAGRDFRQSDSLTVLLNETMARKMGWTATTAVGQRIYSQQSDSLPLEFEVVGVMKDFNYNSLHGDIYPFILMHDPENSDIGHLIVSLKSNNYLATLRKIEEIWHNNLPDTPFDYAFLDSEVARQYEAEVTLSRIIQTFAIMAIVISSLGLFGLSAFSAEQRRKEIGIRKILGASVASVMILLSKDFIRLVLIAFVIASPIAWWAMNKWLNDFAYRISISWWMFAVAGIVATFITLFTVSFQSAKAASTRPLDSLRNK
ncbi:FtsX-like permease family protein [Chitinophaga sp. G-6-1-13]|uniref:FtsX-like permease family protein n=1 Tax=Chitinophaga fulva TaxID=2728842 RepID=A0A848GKD8_9BACT|nr:ABC transporter permease [Chitinophaga fulva]NML37869.1 FtsX-like permease family protein [Chitinophaga fulva]